MLTKLSEALWNYHSLLLIILTPLLLLPLPLVIGTKVLPACFKTATIVPVPKPSTISSLNDWRPVSLTPIMSKRFERLLGDFICAVLPDSLEPLHTATAVMKAQQRSFFRRLKRFGMSSCILGAFYRCAFESILTGRITTGYGNSTAYNHKAHQRVVRVYPECNSINFANWFLLCLPISVIMLLLTWFWLYWLFIGSDFKFLWQCRGEQSDRERAVKKVLEDEYKKLGAISSQEIFTGVVFVVMVLLWLTRSPGFIPGWASLFPHKSNYITDATVALVLGVLLFFVPAHGPSRKYGGKYESGLSLWVARLMTPLGDLPVLATVTIACLIVTTLTEVTSNAATITIFLPILSPLAEAIHVNPLYILIPATLCTSFSFLLPVSNPPNAVVYAYGHITIMDMVKAGLGVNTIGVLALLLAMATWGIPLFSLDTYPEWAPTFNSTTP
ncbi:solute carrier family 13 member 1-like [Neolamprologus brichardi]|uniref:solute carrier family 13 member 1-like n=1 Tax=Neolamprologus brichardi TaxID=32507 RepID=UPI001643B132|nr:solute carrier family 13 member 1-like [Neolamprologus brichardi]